MLLFVELLKKESAFSSFFFFQDLKRAFREHDFLLTAAISADTESMENRYDVLKIAEYLDYIHLMTYDYHGLEGQVVMPNAPLYEVVSVSI